jgi:LPS-assembly protein
MLIPACGKSVVAQNPVQPMTSEAPPVVAPIIAPETVQNSPSSTGQFPDDPSQLALPTARTLSAPPRADAVAIESRQQSYRDGVYTLEKDVVITYKDRRVEADRIEYDSNSGELTLTGHVRLTGGAHHERMEASHGTYNLKTEAGRFYDVSGTYGLESTPHAPRTVYATDSPFLFTGRVVVKRGPDAYDVYDGTVTSCQLEHPDWVLSAAHISLNSQMASARNSVFRLMNAPILFLPYVTHPANSEARQTGFLVPTLSFSSGARGKGLILGEEIYVALSRSADLRVGADYYSKIGWAQNATLRYRGAGLDFATLHFASVMDRRSGSLQQGGQEVLFAARRDFTSHTRAAANLDYLSSYVFREAFSDTFNQAVTSDIVSTAYVARSDNGLEMAVMADRYQGIKQVGQGAVPQQQVHLFHVPSLLLETTDHVLPGTRSRIGNGLEVSVESSFSGLKRTQPSFTTGGIVERFDIRPELRYPIAVADWRVVPALAARETLYTRSRTTPQPGHPPTQSDAGLVRSDLDFSLEIRPPAMARSFVPNHLQRILGSELRHTIEPTLTYRLTDGVNNFENVLRFDAVDVVSNRNEVEYGVTQRIFRRVAHTRGSSCASSDLRYAPGFTTDAPDSNVDLPIEETARSGTSAGDAQASHCESQELISWRFTQKYFFDQNFGGAVVNGRRNIFATTLDLSGVAYITEPREISPLLSRLRVRTSAHTDIAWDFDLDTGARKFTSSNVYLDIHQGNGFAALSYARLDAPGLFFTENPDPISSGASNGVTSLVSDFNQLRLLLGYGNPAKPGLSLAANTGIDLKNLYGATSTRGSTTGGTKTNTVFPSLLQYATVQASYNWNCCGLTLEYRKLELGSVRNDGTYRFNFTLANIGGAGNLRRAERLF